MNGAGMNGVGMGVDATGSAVGGGIGSCRQAVIPAAAKRITAQRIDPRSLRFIDQVRTRVAVGDWPTSVVNPSPLAHQHHVGLAGAVDAGHDGVFYVRRPAGPCHEAHVASQLACL